MSRIPSHPALPGIVLLLLMQTLSGCSDSKHPAGEETTSANAFPVVEQFETLSERDKMSVIERNDHITPATVPPTVELYVATGTQKPTYLPDATEAVATRGAIYQRGLHTAFVEKGGDENLWLALADKKEGTDRIVWQVSTSPFNGLDDHWRTPTGLVAEGELNSEATEFNVNLAELKLDPTPVAPAPVDATIDTRLASALPSVKRRSLKPKQRRVHIRAVAIDQSGTPLGAPGLGVEVLYGEQVTVAPDTTNPAYVIKFPLLSGIRAGTVNNGGENPNLLTDLPEHFYSSSSVSPWYFHPTDFASQAHTLYLQVLKVVPKNQDDDWRAPTGLIYERKLQKGDGEFEQLISNNYYALPVDIHSLATVSPSQFYVRAVALSNAQHAGEVVASYSKTVIIKYGENTSQFTYFAPPEVKVIDAALPNVRLVQYQPIRWEYNDWMYYYQVVRQPTNKEYYAMMPSAMVPNADALVPGLTPGKVIKLTPPKPSDSSWLKDAWNAVSSFFGSLVSFLEDIANWVSQAYDDVKSGLVEFVANQMPLIPDQWRDELQQALTYGLDYGLASVGIPPSLPNFDELSNMGADYLASTALEQAGIPANELTTDAVKDLSKGVSDQMSKSANSGNTPNPMNWNFVRQYPAALYRPAFMELEITNPHNYVTAAGTLNGRISRQLSSAELGEPAKMWMYSAYGSSLYFELYRPVVNVTIPRLLPHQSLKVPVFFQEYTGAAFPFHPLKVSTVDFLRMYNFFDPFKFSFSVAFDLPPAETYAQSQGLPSGELYEYATKSKQVFFEIDPADSYVP